MPEVDMIKVQEDLLRDEGFEKSAYKDSLGYLTIGIGKLIDQRKGAGLTKRQALYLLNDDLFILAGEMDQHMLWWRGESANRQRALLNMAYQMGVPGLLKFEKMLWAMQHHDFTTAYKECLDSLWASQTPERAKRVALMIKEG
jgi:lysozyme